jgi:8-hydroxy-5-deazaflavin:NADPH oxidoreductase
LVISDNTSIAILGSGNIGAALARRFASKKIAVGIANAHGPETLADLVTQLGPSIVPLTLADACRAGTVIFAIPFDAVPGVTQGVEWAGKTVVDATNPHTAADIRGVSSTADVRAYVPGAAVVKAFNTLPAAVLGDEPQRPEGRRVVFIASRDRAAAASVSALIGQLGFAAIDLSDVDPDGRLQQRGGALFLAELVAQT